MLTRGAEPSGVRTMNLKTGSTMLCPITHQETVSVYPMRQSGSGTLSIYSRICRQHARRSPSSCPRNVCVPYPTPILDISYINSRLLDTGGISTHFSEWRSTRLKRHKEWRWYETMYPCTRQTSDEVACTVPCMSRPVNTLSIIMAT